MLPGAVDVLPLNAQFSVFPLFAISHVSVSFGPVTPKFAVAALGFVTESGADSDTPPYDAPTVAAIVPPTRRVDTRNVALVAPPATVTLAGTVTGSFAVSVTTAPPTGAPPVSVTVPVTGPPPTTVAALSVSVASFALAVTASDAVCWPPLADAVMKTVPAATAVTVNVADDAPEVRATVDGTVAIAVALLVSVTLVPPDGAAVVRVTV